ncbi:Tau-tubulin kinase 1 [Aphelenchoides bicaudatus]|nr:Tau-tubulin kinase 1 [Aphelenchoides bicaudatus]
MGGNSPKNVLIIKPETLIDSAKAKYIVGAMLGEGSHGSVYKVYLEADKSKEYAMKIDKKFSSRKDSKLNMEIAILKEVSTLHPEKCHFTKIIDQGKKETCTFIIMELLGKSLADLKYAQPHEVFSLGTGLGAASQCLEATEGLHNIGFIHRDIKPGNHAVGLGANEHIVYMLDFGIARKITKEDNELKTPRQVSGFVGTTRFASLACHRKEEMGKKDDCESWFYLFMDLILISGLPWKRITNRDLVKKVKEESRKESSAEAEVMYSGISKIRPELVKIIGYIDGLTYPERPDYELIQKMLREAAEKAEVSMEFSFRTIGCEGRAFNSL